MSDLTPSINIPSSVPAVMPPPIPSPVVIEPYMPPLMVALPDRADRGTQYNTQCNYDKNSGYQFDLETGLYRNCTTDLFYDPISNYYWDSGIQKYLYWDQEKETYVLVPTAYDCYAPGTRRNKSQKQDKVKRANKMSKHMKWQATHLNRKKESSNSRANSHSAATSRRSASATADTGSSVLEKKNTTVPMSAAVTCRSEKHQQQKPISLVADYGGDTESSSEEKVAEDVDYLDFTNMICNLCKRLFTSADALTKHSKMSWLHEQKLEAKKGKKKRRSRKTVYRDRAKECRMKYGEPQPSKLKKSQELVEFLPVATTSVMKPIEMFGNKLLQKMDCTEGEGLGKSDQGRTTTVQVEQRSSAVALENKDAAHSALVAESYKECEKKMM